MSETRIYYKRFKRARLFHFTPAVGYNCPEFFKHKRPDYEVVKVVKVDGPKKHLKGRRVLITWGLNLTETEQICSGHTLAFEIGQPKHAEIVMAVV